MTYLRYEVLRTWRNRDSCCSPWPFPGAVLSRRRSAQGRDRGRRLSSPLLDDGMIAWGSMVAVISSGARIAAERAVGWTRQLRITPLPTWSYFSAKIFCGYMMALLSMIVLFAAGSLIGVRLDVTQWLVMIGLLLWDWFPLRHGIMFGHLLKLDSLGPAIGGVTSLFALLGGAYGPLVTSGFLFDVVKCLPSYWLVQAGKTALVGAAALEAWSSSRRGRSCFPSSRSRVPARHEED